MPTNSAVCESCKNDNCLIKKHCESPTVKPFLSNKNTITCKKSQQFILEGAPVSGLYFIHQGCVKVYKISSSNREQIIRFSKNGEIVGHRGFGTNYVYDISASALENTVLCNFPTDVLIEMLHKEPPLMFDFMLFYADQLQKSEANAKRFAQMTVRDKVINGLLFIHRKFGQVDGYFNITLSRNDIADFAGTSREQVIRVISSLKKEGILSANGKKLGIINLGEFEAAMNEKEHFLEG